jgi:ABC-type antimicrobial peptide transport system permease subunit
MTSLIDDSKSNLELIHYVYDNKTESGEKLYINSLYYLDIWGVNQEATRMKKIGYYGSLIFGFFAIIMMLNFIITNISANKKNIGIIRAIGARGIDIFNIYFIETIFIAFITSIFSIILASIISKTNFILRIVYVIFIPVAYINLKEMVLITLITFLTTLIGCLAPILKYSLKKPIDVIRQE